MIVRQLSGTSIYITGMLVLEKQECEEKLEKLVGSVSARRDDESEDFIAIHNQIKQLTTRYVQLINEIETMTMKLEA